MTFDPQQHFRVLERKDKKTGEIIRSNYLDVRWRILWFREDHPKGRIVTEEVYVGPIWTTKTEWKGGSRSSTEMEVPGVRFKASVYDGDGNLLASDYKSETMNDFPDYYEKSSTGAIGRALALAGYGTQFAEEFDEEDTATGNIALADSPVEIKVKEFEPNKNSNLSVVASTTPAQPSADSAQCAECGKPVEGYSVGPRKVSVAELIATSQKEYGVTLCREHYAARRKPAGK